MGSQYENIFTPKISQITVDGGVIKKVDKWVGKYDQERDEEDCYL